VTRRAAPRFELFDVELDGRRVGHVITDDPGTRDEWEIHHEQDELLYLVSGAVDVVLCADLDVGDESVLHLTGGTACVVPKATWHRQVVHEASVMVFLSPPSEHRPYEPADGWD
jgi:mannose-6-phosphate isomerase-like protein (cupin superfamily)